MPDGRPTDPCLRPLRRPRRRSTSACVSDAIRSGLKDSSASQVHGTVVIAIALAIVGLALIARLALAGLGPFPATFVSAVPDGDGLAVTLTVTNEGSSAGQTTCRVTDPRSQSGARVRVRAQPADRARARRSRSPSGCPSSASEVRDLDVVRARRPVTLRSTRDDLAFADRPRGAGRRGS